MTKNLNRRNKKGRRLNAVAAAMSSVAAHLAPIGQRIRKRFYDGQKKARWGDGLETCFLTDGFTLLSRV